MNNKIRFHNLERAQIIPIVVVALLGLIAMAALLLDGGAIMLNRRGAQNAADAAALAGARIYCRHPNPDLNEVGTTINQYVTQNDATLINWSIDTSNVGVLPGLKKGEVVVTAQVEHESFFARIFNQDNLPAVATAGAGCFPYGPSVVLPIAYPCYPPDINYTDVPGETIESDDCSYHMLEWEYFEDIATGCGMPENPLLGNLNPSDYPGAINCINTALFDAHKELIYVVVNEEKVCAKDPANYDPTNEIICDLVGGRSQLNSSARGWLNLSDNNSNTNVFRQWVDGTREVELSIHTWLAFMPGATSMPGFTALSDRLFDIVWIPVFNDTCVKSTDAEYPLVGGYPTSSEQCWENAHVEFPDDDGVCKAYTPSEANAWAHVIGYAPFFPTCVRVNSDDIKAIGPQDTSPPDDFIPECPGFGMAINYNYTEGTNIVYPNFDALQDVTYSFEGYFINPEYLSNTESLNIEGADLGVYVASLTR